MREYATKSCMLGFRFLIGFLEMLIAPSYLVVSGFHAPQRFSRTDYTLSPA